MTRTLRPGDTFFDIGANVGYYSLLASRVVGPSGRVIAFEPLLDNLEYLSRHVRLNQLTNTDVLGVACSDSTGIVTFARGANGALGRIAENGSGGDMLVPALTLDDFHARTGLVPNVMKIDVEGAELRVLTGAQALLAKSHPKIFLSTHGDQMRTECFTFLRDLRYQITPINSPDPTAATEYLALSAA
jgi:FkbM family methyltransferase